ncbi:MAG TPA: NAD(P)-binding protein [Desulfitobacterium dehalogenans]|uniref:NAD(P)-binding protein n=1 Tax=Desulfitobacterium dehalogenans TaxID=36854 RepID=A0A7C6Z5F9_9FIRM|nr:NAD(P)-binding protein [Desulfitobacterium dehalogenans]
MEQDELRRLESKCIQESPPACTAGCPIHVDARKFLQASQNQDWQGALAALWQKQPFPGIISRICDHPCQGVCQRGEVGEAISISALEKYCVENHIYKTPKAKPMAYKNQKVAVIGGGLRGLTAALDLAKKGFQITIFEAMDRLGGRLWAYPEQRLPTDVIREELKLLNRPNVEIRVNSPITRQDLPSLQEEFDALYIALAAGAAPAGNVLGANCSVDKHTSATSQTGVFAGAYMGEPSPIQAVAEGRRAALSIDRYLQGASLTASREWEGEYISSLFVNLEGIAPLDTVVMKDENKGYSGEEALAEARRCLNCQCLECVKACKYLESYGRYPKKYLREIYNNDAIVKGTRYANKMINSCSLCGLCAEICPHELNMGEVCLSSREGMVRNKRMPPSAYDFALQDMAFSNSEQFQLTRHQPEFSESRFVFFPGCQLSGSAPDHVEEVYALLTAHLPGGMGLMLHCCGAPAQWAGEQEMFQKAMADLVKEWESLGRPQLIVACSSCYSLFKEMLPVVSLWEVLNTLELSLPVHNIPYKFAVQDPCTTRHEESIHRAVRELLNKLNCQVEELPFSKELTKCCGFGGLMSFANRGLAKEVTVARSQESSLDYIAYCAMCRDRFSAYGKRIVHILDLIFPKAERDAAAREDPGFSRRHENRAKLKRKMLREIWREALESERGDRAIELIIREEIRKSMEERLILIEDVQQAIQAAEKSGRKFINPENGHSLAHHRPSRVTYWVEYETQESGAYLVHNAYSHRMEVIEEVKS